MMLMMLTVLPAPSRCQVPFALVRARARLTCPCVCLYVCVSVLGPDRGARRNDWRLGSSSPAAVLLLPYYSTLLGSNLLGLGRTAPLCFARLSGPSVFLHFASLRTAGRGCRTWHAMASAAMPCLRAAHWLTPGCAPATHADSLHATTHPRYISCMHGWLVRLEAALGRFQAPGCVHPPPKQ